MTMIDQPVMTMAEPGPTDRPIPGQDGTFDIGNSKGDRIRRYKVLAHMLVHYNLPPDGLTQCPYCGGLFLPPWGD